MYQKHIESLKSRLSDLKNSLMPAEKILGGKAPNIEKRVAAVNSLDTQIIREVLEEMVRHQFAQDEKAVQTLSEAAKISTNDLHAIAEATFDIAKAKENDAVMFDLASNYLLDTNRHNEGVLTYAYRRILDKNYAIAETVLNNHRNKLNKTNLKNFGVKFFQESMNFDSHSTQRDYAIPVKVSVLFELEHSTTSQAATAQFDYNFNHKKYILAAEIARQFSLPEAKIRKAGAEAFKIKFKKFLNKMHAGEYRGKFTIAPGDPYKTALAVVEKYSLLTSPEGNDTESVGHLRDVQNQSATAVRRLGKVSEFPNMEMYARITIISMLIDDYGLTGSDNPQLKMDCLNISRSLLSEIDEHIEKLADAIQYYDALEKIYESNEGLREEIRRIVTKIFDLYCTNNRYKSAKETADCFELSENQVYIPLKKKCIEFLEKKEEDTYKKILQWFDRYPLVERFRQDDDFLHKIFFVYQSAVYANDIEYALRLAELSRLSKQRRFEPVRSRLTELLNVERDDEATTLMQQFNIRPKHMLNLFVSQYIKRTENNTSEGQIFREKFGVSVMDVGMMRWFFTEVIPIASFR